MQLAFSVVVKLLRFAPQTENWLARFRPEAAR